MAAKYQLITELYRRTGKAVTGGMAELFVVSLPQLQVPL